MKLKLIYFLVFLSTFSAFSQKVFEKGIKIPNAVQKTEVESNTYIPLLRFNSKKMNFFMEKDDLIKSLNIATMDSIPEVIGGNNITVTETASGTIVIDGVSSGAGTVTETDVLLVNNYSNIKKIDNVITEEGTVYITYTQDEYNAGYTFVSNWDNDGTLDPNSILFDLEVGDTVYIEGLDGQLASLYISDYFDSFVEPGYAGFEFGSINPTDFLDANGVPISGTNTNFIDNTSTNTFKIFVQEKTITNAETVADALVFVEDRLKPYLGGNLMSIDGNNSVHLGGVANYDTELNLGALELDILTTNGTDNYKSTFDYSNVDLNSRNVRLTGASSNDNYNSYLNVGLNKVSSQVNSTLLNLENNALVLSFDNGSSFKHIFTDGTVVHNIGSSQFVFNQASLTTNLYPTGLDSFSSFSLTGGSYNVSITRYDGQGLGYSTITDSTAIIGFNSAGTKGEFKSEFGEAKIQSNLSNVDTRIFVNQNSFGFGKYDDINNTINETYLKLLTSSGNLGLGIVDFDSNDTGEKLQVNGSVKVSDFIKLEPTIAPSSPSRGTVYYDSTLETLRCWNGTSWNNLF